MTVTDAELAWVAGFLEGEGTFSFARSVQIQATQKQRWPALELQRLCGGKIYEIKGGLYGCWMLYGPPARELMQQLRPLMSPNRQVQIDRALARPMPGSANGRKTHCPSGHEYIPANTYRYKNRRLCRACQIARRAA